MKRIVMVCVAAAAAVVVVGSVDSSAARKPSKLEFLAQLDTNTTVDTGEPGDTPGDLLIQTYTAVQGTRTIGRGNLACIAVKGTRNDGALECDTTLVLRKGRITAHLEFVVRGVTNFDGIGAVTGGTGVYQGVGGEVRVRAIAGSTTASKVTLRLRP
jgi:hypothetical protein